MSDADKSRNTQSRNAHSGNWPTRIVIVSVVLAVTLIGLYIYAVSLLPISPILRSVPQHSAEVEYTNSTDILTGDPTDTVSVETMDADYVFVAIKQDRGYIYEGSHNGVISRATGHCSNSLSNCTPYRYQGFFSGDWADGRGFVLDTEGQHVKIRGVKENNTIITHVVEDTHVEATTPRHRWNIQSRATLFNHG